MKLSMKIPYRVKDVLNIEFPEPLLGLKPRFLQSRVGPDVIYAEVEIGEILVRPSITPKGHNNGPWVYHDGSRICFNAECKDLNKILKAAPLNNSVTIVIGEEKSYAAELAEDSVRIRPIDVKEILGSTRYVDRSVVLIRKRGFRKKIMVADQGFLYTTTSFCMERREGHSLVAFEAGGYTRIYFGAEHGGYVIHDTSGSPTTCSIGYRVATIGIRDRGSVYIGKNLYIEAPSRSVGIAWIPEDRVLISYDQKGGWLLESDLKSFKPIARLPNKPVYLGRLDDSHILMINGGLVVIKDSLMIKPEIYLESSKSLKSLSVSSRGLVIDSGDRVAIRSIDGREMWSVEKDPDTMCNGYGDKIVCIRKNMVGIIEPSEGEVVIERIIKDIPRIIINSEGKISSVSVSGDADIINIARVDGDIEISIAPRVLGKPSLSYIELEDIIAKHRAEVELRAEPPAISIESARLVMARTGLHIECGSPGYAEVVLRLGGNRLHNLYKYVARITSRGKVIGISSFHPAGLSSNNEEMVRLRICLKEAPTDGDTWLEIAATRGDLDGEAFHKTPLRIEVIEPIINITLDHYGDKSEAVVEVKSPRGVIDNIYVSVRCANTSFEKADRGGGVVGITIGGCEVPAKIVTVVEDQGFRWASSREIQVQDLVQCIGRYSEIAGLAGIMCSRGGFYKHASPLTHRDLSPVRETRILNMPGKGTQVLIVADRYAAYSITTLGGGYVVRQGLISPGINILDLGIDAELEPLRLSVFDGTAYREYLLKPQNISEIVMVAVKTSYKLLQLLGGLGL